MKILRIRIAVAPLTNLSQKFSGVASIRVPDDFDATKYNLSIEGHREYQPVIVGSNNAHLPRVAAGAVPVAGKPRRGRPRAGEPTWLDHVKRVMGKSKMTSVEIRDALASQGATSSIIARIMSTNSKGRNAAFKRVGRGKYQVRG